MLPNTGFAKVLGSVYSQCPAFCHVKTAQFHDIDLPWWLEVSWQIRVWVIECHGSWLAQFCWSHEPECTDFFLVILKMSKINSEVSYHSKDNSNLASGHQVLLLPQQKKVHSHHILAIEDVDLREISSERIEAAANRVVVPWCWFADSPIRPFGGWSVRCFRIKSQNMSDLELPSS